MSSEQPRVSVVTPSYNQGSFLEETMLSVLNQKYPNLEYMVMDGGSADASVEIIKKYATRLSYWQTRKDRGPADAINQGWKRASGKILCYLNSDDVLVENAIQIVVDAFQNHPDADVIYGDTTFVDEKGVFIKNAPSEIFDLKNIFTTWKDPIYQPSAFLRKELIDRNGYLDESFQFCFDFEYWIRIAETTRFLRLPLNLSFARSHVSCKSVAQQDVQARELMRIYRIVRDKPSFTNSGVSKIEAEKALYFRAAEHFLHAGHKREAFSAHISFCRRAFPPHESIYRILRYAGRIFFRN